jgi:hypothetical protein
MDELCREGGEPLVLPFRKSVLDANGLALDIAQGAEPLPESLE